MIMILTSMPYHQLFYYFKYVGNYDHYNTMVDLALQKCVNTLRHQFLKPLITSL